MSTLSIQLGSLSEPSWNLPVSVLEARKSFWREPSCLRAWTPTSSSASHQSRYCSWEAAGKSPFLTVQRQRGLQYPDTGYRPSVNSSPPRPYPGGEGGGRTVGGAAMPKNPVSAGGRGRGGLRRGARPGLGPLERAAGGMRCGKMAAPSPPPPTRAVGTWGGVRRRCQRLLYWVPVLFISSILCWSYYAYVTQLCLLTITNIGEKVVCLVAYHIFFMLFVWSYWKTIFTLPMNPSKEFHLSYSDKESLEREPRGESQQEVLRRAAKDLPIYTRTMSGAIRYCDRCHLVKPDRCHHCSVCDKCILKMDHHCPWVNNCVGFSNYKFFLLFLAYSLLYCLFIAATDLQYFIKFWTNGLPDTQAKFHIMFLFFAAAMFSVSLSSLFGYHCWLVSKNKSTLEVFRAPIFRHRTDKNGFSLGFSKNLRQVFGDEKKYWLLPVFSSLGDGCSFPTCLVNQDPEQASTPGCLNSTSKNENHLFPAKPLRDSQSHLLTDTPSWSETSAKAEKGKVGMSNPALTMENET
ncbi:LOW QUALITY PROTEIN: palmitoyltransferase ZDHHC2 [Amazona ochrocephala]